MKGKTIVSFSIGLAVFLLHVMLFAQPVQEEVRNRSRNEPVAAELMDTRHLTENLEQLEKALKSFEATLDARKLIGWDVSYLRGKMVERTFDRAKKDIQQALREITELRKDTVSLRTSVQLLLFLDGIVDYTTELYSMLLELWPQEKRAIKLSEVILAREDSIMKPYMRFLLHVLALTELCDEQFKATHGRRP